MSKYIYWYDTRLKEYEVDEFFATLVDIINRLRDLDCPKVDAILDDYKPEVYALEIEDFKVRLKFNGDCDND